MMSSDDELISQAQELLARLGFDSERTNERSAMVLLALLQLREGMTWDQAGNPLLGTRAIMDWIANNFGVAYKPNTRETIRRFTLHQFVIGQLVEENADDPMRPINSPKWNYRVTEDALSLIRGYTQSEFDKHLAGYVRNHVFFKSLAQERRDLPKTDVQLPSGRYLNLSPGGQNKLIKSIIEDFLPRFVPNGTVLYVDDTDHGMGVIDRQTMDELGIKLKTREKAPDVIIWDHDRQWLFLIEAASTHGPIDVTRKMELKRIFPDHFHQAVLVSCFPDRNVMRRFLSQLAWESEAWCSDTPDHMVHFNGSRFMGPYGEQ
ncbi:BsuBI/PstI family type II restriction endonuclease [Bifidobacterium crudilactis]|uniref:BsuBI/PstI family type II restriction endonuclease n=1 Tax=Bifidobacterium crudilactis TaxID=327277 RepID=UPI0026483EBC|nr:BsuBI/PstI family type II restriction endonuclease [Bifidobacterium crudilactis]MDN5973070.1 restriction endonuclease [Bifidobacterium crudilactis]MDN6000289.1 restriction endonuclease [Bifidobacterium crudilactis]MDN6208998.1 restriction endonuclease [Bifidobacterium crudilactis]MDN6467902.1 restriction endonuclease [Bifidobacterium crudilactis]MDN6558658.1 restriction endonuclease [Bifidobacterium crudilactis]